MTNTLVSGHLALPALPVSQINNLNKIRGRTDSSMPETLEQVEPFYSNQTSTSSTNNVETDPDSKRLGMSLRSGRKAIITPVSSNKRVVSVGPNDKNLNVPPGLSKKVAPNTSKTTSASGKKDSHPVVSPKGQTVSDDSVRAKLRESLSSALGLVTEQRRVSSDLKVKMETEVEPGTQEGINEQKPLACQEDTQTWNYMGPEFQNSSILAGEDSIFGDGLFFKDELLQGNGLSWASEFKEVPSDEQDETILSPDSLALEIESELFKLYGGVNKKYKEKGRSLLFNLKDRNNPELRERVMSGEIPPDRLCSMTAEELASKELSQWRIAKAEELDQMKVLPDSDVNVRRLVKKTHKGEYQVDLDPDIGVSEEISPVISVPSQKRQKMNDSDNPNKVEEYEKCEITIPTDGTDMQGLMVDDVKDLPPIVSDVSLDEFMETLNKDPPFENLPVNSGTNTVETGKEDLEVDLKSVSPVYPLEHPVNVTSQKKEELNMEAKIKLVEKKSSDVQKRSGTEIVHRIKEVPVWEGLLQLNISSNANFVTFYKSGEKANTKEWAGFFDIKGRVRLDAFDKFLQALPMSRSRAIMVSHFALKEDCTDSERSGLVELVDSYITDERLGFAEPAPGVELYLCPPRTKTVDMIINHLPKSYTEKLLDINDGLIGIVVWRKVQITPVISPNSLSHHKHETEYHTGGYITGVNNNRNNVSFAPISAPPPPILSKPPQPEEEEEDDVPPGFGPAGHRDDDDLPEFNFSGGPNQPTSRPNPNPTPVPRIGSQHNFPQTPARQVDQMRELVQKYGQNGRNNNTSGGIQTQPWNDDDDDDIPEWQPQASHTVPQSGVPQPIQNPAIPPHMTHFQAFQQAPRPPMAQPLQPLQPLQPPMRVQQQGMWWPYGVNSAGNLPSGQFNGLPNPGHMPRDWRANNGSNNKGF